MIRIVQFFFVSDAYGRTPVRVDAPFVVRMRLMRQDSAIVESMMAKFSYKRQIAAVTSISSPRDGQLNDGVFERRFVPFARPWWFRWP